MNKLIITLALLALSACAQMGVTPAQSFNERLGYTEAGITAIEKAAASAVLDREISTAAAEHILTSGRSAMLLIVAARDEGNTPVGQGMLAKASEILTALQAYEEAKK